MRFEYKVTVIIPVYNAEKTLARTMDSLFAQTMAQGLMEILLVDDGSQDGSPALCDAYARDHENVRVIHQENKGVSAARNAGIRAAKGKYLMYLDSDDAVSPESIRNIVAFFDKNYNAIDVVVYPNAFCYEDGSKEYHYRNQIMTSTGIYDVEKTLYISLTTPNVVVKNLGRKNLFFDEALKFHEDEAYLADMVMRSGKLGYVKEADYWYIQHDGQTTSKYSNPYYIFEPSMALYERLIADYTVNGSVRKYIQTLILNDFNWKLAQGKLFPDHYTGAQWDAAASRIRKIMDHIETSVVLRHPIIPRGLKYTLLALKRKGRPFVEAAFDHLAILDHTGTLEKIRAVQINLNQINIRENQLYILGYIQCPAFFFCSDSPRLFAVTESTGQTELPFFTSRFSCIENGQAFSRCFGFHFSLPLEKRDKVHLEVDFRGQTYQTHFWYSAKVSAHPDLGCNYLEGAAYSALCGEQEIEIVRSGSFAFRRAQKAFARRLFKTKKKQWLARKLMKRYRGKKTWLYFDSHDSLDNGYYQFLHDIEKQDGIRRYYVYHADNPKIVEGKFSGKARKAMVAFGSRKHKCLMAAADKVLTAFIDRSCWLPFDPDTYQYYADLFRYEVVYLQHGVMHAKLPDMYSKEKVWQADRVVVSTRFERENLLELGYREQDILTCGMPRLDNLDGSGDRPKERRILFAPSWRLDLVTTVNNVRTPVEKFYRSEYYLEFSAFLKDPGLHRLLQEADLYLDVQIHPMFACYSDCFFPVDSPRVREVHSAHVGDYLACITDFSSFMFDFIYLKKPVISYFPDRKSFRTGTHSYKDFYCPLEDGFAIYCIDGHTALQALEQLVESDFRLPEPFAQRAQTLYYDQKESHGDQLYTMLTGG